MKKNLILLSFALFASLFCLQAQWQPCNSPGTTQIYSISNDSNNWYSIIGNGLYRSTNNGNDWSYYNTMGVIDYQAHKCILNHRDTIFIGSKQCLYYSTDAGQFWEIITEGLIINQFFTSGDIISIGSNSEEMYAITHEKLYIVDRNNKKFIPIEITLGNGFTTLNVSEKYILIGSFSQTFLPQRQPNIFISKDGGISWKAITDSISKIDEWDINCFALINDTIYAGTDNGIFVSYDEGIHWELMKNGLSGYEITNILITGEGVYAGAGYNGGSASTTTKSGMFYTTEIGSFWEKKENGLSNKDIQTISSINGKVIAGTVQGLFYTTNKGDNWVSINQGLGGGSILSIVSNSDKIYTHLYQEGLFVSSDSGETWQLIFDYTKQMSSYSSLAVDNNNIYIASQMNWKFIYSLDNGVSWNLVPNTTAINSRKVYDFSIINHNLIACTDKGIFISEDSAKSWISLNTDLEQYKFKFAYFENNNIYAATSNSGLIISTNMGISWGDKIIVRDSNDVITNFLKIKENLFVSSYYYGLFRSTDNGVSWDSINNGLSNQKIMSLLEFNNNIFASTENGIFLSTNNGDNWREISDGLTIKYIYELLIVGDNIYATSVGGIFKAKLSDFGIVSVDDSKTEAGNYFYAYPPYPIPAKNIVKSLIYWDTNIDINDDEINAYDIYGVKVSGKENITIDKLTNYSGILTWDCSSVTTGIYLIQMKHGTRSWTLKVLVNK